MPNQDNVSDIRVDELSIRTAIAEFDLKPFLIEMNIEENIFKTSLTGSIVLSDSYNIPEKFPIVGEETVNINISLSGIDGRDDDLHLNINPPRMHVNAITGRYFSGKTPKAQIFTLELVSEQYMSNIHSKVSKSYNNTYISDIVFDIYSKYLGNPNKLLIEPTDSIESCIVPNLHPLEAIKWITQRAVQDSGAGVNYLFFETLSGVFFTSINRLAEKEPQFTYKYIPRTGDSKGVEALSVGDFRIKNLYFMNQFDKASNSINGLYASKLITHDIVRKKITQHDFNGFNDFVSLNHFGTFPVIASSEMEIKSADLPRVTYAPPEDDNNFPVTTEKDLSYMTDSHVEFYPKHKQLYARNIGDEYDNKVETWKLQRTSQIKSFDNITLIIESSGNPFLRVGHTVNIELPSPESTDSDKSSDDDFDKHLSGIYLVTSIKHIFQQIEAKDQKIGYTMKVEVVKDALEDVIQNRTAIKED